MNTTQGYSLLELLTTLCVSSILITLATPSLSGLRNSAAVQSSSDKLLRSVAATRQLAILRGQAITLANRDGTWSNGWTIFADTNSNGIQDDDEPTIKAQDPLDKHIELYANSPVATYIRYLPDGRGYLNNGGFQAGTFWVCHQHRQTEAHQLVLSSGGRLRQSRGQCPY